MTTQMEESDNFLKHPTKRNDMYAAPATIQTINRVLLRSYEKIEKDEVDRLCDLLTHYLSQNIDVNERNINGETALMRACRSKYLAPVVRLLLEAGASTLYVNGMGNTALDEAVYFECTHSITMVKNANQREYNSTKMIKFK